MKRLMFIFLGLPLFICATPFCVFAETFDVACSVAALINAVNTANATPGQHTLNLAGGCTYSLTQADNIDVQGDNGLPKITGDLTLVGQNTIIERQASAPEFRFFSVEENASLTLRQISLQNGRNGSGAKINGGAIYNNGGEVTLSGCIVSDNFAGCGGAIYNEAGSLHVTGGRFSDNTAFDRGGGAILGGGTITIHQSVFSGNTATEAGAIGVWDHLTVANTSFINNRAQRDDNSSGGAVSLITPNAFAVITGSTFSGNSTSSAFARGGAVATTGTLTVINSTFYQNAAQTRGGAIAIEDGNAILRHVTIAENSAGYAGGVFVGGVLREENSIIANNDVGENCRILGGAIVDGGGNLRYPFSDDTCVGTYGNPLLKAPADNGGTTFTMALDWGSDAIDRIDGADGCGIGVTVDQRGVQRPQPAWSRCDCGAYEKQYLGSDLDVRCFIATAAFGSPLDPWVTTLRQFRDRFLLTHTAGRKIVETYYRLSPAWAHSISENAPLRGMVRLALVPVCGFAWIVLGWNLTATVFLLILIAACFIQKKRKTTGNYGSPV